MDLFNNSIILLLFKEAHKFENKSSILGKLLEIYANSLNIYLIWDGMYTKYLIIHFDNSLKIDKKWANFIKTNKLLPEELNLYKLIKSERCVNIILITKFIAIFINKKENKFLAELLGIDGFLTQNPLKYINNLKIGDKGFNHVQVTRLLYQKIKGICVKTVFFNLLKIYTKYIVDDEIQELIKNNLESDTYNKSIETLYINNIDDLETTALTKIAQLKLLKKKMNRPTPSKRKKKKVVNVFTS